MNSLMRMTSQETPEKDTYKIRVSHKNLSTIMDKVFIDFHFLRDNFGINLSQDKDRNPVVLTIDVKGNNEILITKNSFTTPVSIKLPGDDMWKSLLVSDAFELQNQVNLKVDKYEIKMEKVMIKKSPKRVIMNTSTSRQTQPIARANSVLETSTKKVIKTKITTKDVESNSSPFPLSTEVKQEISQNSNKSSNLWDYFGGILNSTRKSMQKTEEDQMIASEKENISVVNSARNNNQNHNQSNWKRFSELLPMDSQIIFPKRRNNKVIEDLPDDIVKEEEKYWEKKKLKTEDKHNVKLEDSLNLIKIESPAIKSEDLLVPNNKFTKDSIKIETYEEEKSTSFNDLSSTTEDIDEKRTGKTSSNSEDGGERSKLKRLKKILDEKREEAAKNSVTKIQSQQIKQENAETCAICLSDITDFLGKLEICIHKFCFSCIKDWSNVTNECPLCKGRFDKIVKMSLSGEVIENMPVEYKRQVYEDNIEDYIDEEIDEFCYECANNEDPDVLLICDGCGFHCCHTYCCNPPLEFVPAGDWFCKFCTRGSRRGRRRNNANNTTRNTNNSTRQTRNNTSTNSRRTNSRTTNRNTRNNNTVRESQPSLLERLFAQAGNDGFDSPIGFQHFRHAEDEEENEDDQLENLLNEATETPSRNRYTRDIDESEEIDHEYDFSSRNSRNQRNQNTTFSRGNSNVGTSSRVNRENSNSINMDSLNSFRYPPRNYQRVNS